MYAQMTGFWLPVCVWSLLTYATVTLRMPVPYTREIIDDTSSRAMKTLHVFQPYTWVYNILPTMFLPFPPPPLALGSETNPTRPPKAWPWMKAQKG